MLGARLRLGLIAGYAALTTVFASAAELDNGILRVGVDTNLYGGAISYLSLSGSSQNLINLHDRGRQVQQSYYAGDRVDRTSEGQNPAWSPWRWNPVQAGDSFGNAPEVVAEIVANGEIYTKTIPLLWDMDREPAEAVMEQWTSLLGHTVHVRNRLTVDRTDSLWTLTETYQELPALYTNTILCRQFTYVGDSPWTWDAAMELSYRANLADAFPWLAWGPDADTIRSDGIIGQLEQWSANLDSNDWGLGVYYRDTEVFIGGLVQGCGGDVDDSATTYIAPLKALAIDKDTVLEWEYDLIVGTQAQIRDFVYTEEFTHPYVFNWRYYVNQYPDLCAAGITSYKRARRHWLRHGIAAGRRAHPYFAANEYLELHTDLREMYGATNYHEAIRHYIRAGKADNRAGAITKHPLPKAICAAIENTTLTDPYVFDWRYYIHNYPDLCAAGLTTRAAATNHWLRNGIAARRRAHSHVHSVQYLARYPDLQAVFGDDYRRALKHYVDLGRNAARVATSEQRQPAHSCPGVPAAWPIP